MQSCEVMVAVGTTIADRPPHRSVRARLRTRLLPRMSGGETNIRIGMQNAGLRNPPVQDGEQTPRLCRSTSRSSSPDSYSCHVTPSTPGAAFRFNAKKLSRSRSTVRWWSRAVNRSCFLSFAACRTPFNPWDMRFPLCVGCMLDGTMFSSVCALPSLFGDGVAGRSTLIRLRKGVRTFHQQPFANERLIVTCNVETEPYPVSLPSGTSEGPGSRPPLLNNNRRGSGK